MLMREAPPHVQAPPSPREDVPPAREILCRTMRLDSGCLIWVGPFHHETGPFIKWRGKQVQVHRALWFYKYGVLPAFRLRRTCAASACVAPDHRTAANAV